jgi:uncharacterized protein
MTEIVDEPERHRLVLQQDGHTAELDYRLRPDKLIIVHTEVPEELGGHGIGGELVRHAIDLAKDRGLAVAPWCPFARSWLKEHPDVAATVNVDWEKP